MKSDRFIRFKHKPKKRNCEIKLHNKNLLMPQYETVTGRYLSMEYLIWQIGTVPNAALLIIQNCHFAKFAMKKEVLTKTIITNLLSIINLIWWPKVLVIYILFFVHRWITAGFLSVCAIHLLITTHSGTVLVQLGVVDIEIFKWSVVHCDTIMCLEMLCLTVTGMFLVLKRFNVGLNWLGCLDLTLRLRPFVVHSLFFSS